MKIKHHLIRKFHESKQAPLWKWAVVIFLIIAMPMFFLFVRTTEIQQVLDSSDTAGQITSE
jgi:hypothetical protein